MVHYMQLVLLILALPYFTVATLCPSNSNGGDVDSMVSCSVGKSLADWGKCMECSGACSRLSQFQSSCVLGYSQVIQFVLQRSCDLDVLTCTSPFGSVLNTTCSAASQSTVQCATFPLIPVVAGCAGGVLVCCVVAAVLLECRRRRDKLDHERRKQARKERKARAAENGDTGTGKSKWRPSFVKRTKAVVNEMSKHTSLKLAQHSGIVTNSALSPMSSMPPPIPSHGSFRHPPPPVPSHGSNPALTSHNSFRGPPQALSSHNSFRGPPPGVPPLTSHNSFRGPPPGVPLLTSHNSFRGPPPGAPPLASHNSFRGQPPLTSHNSFKGSPQLTAKGSFRGPPPLETHPNYAQLQAQGLASHNSFHGAPVQLQAHNSFHNAPLMQAVPVVGVPPPMPGPTPVVPPSRNSNVLNSPAPVVPPSRNSGAISNSAPPATPVPASSGNAGGDTNDLLGQIRAGQALKKASQAPKEDKPAAEKKPASSSGGGLMAELQKKMKKKQGGE